MRGGKARHHVEHLAGIRPAIDQVAAKDNPAFIGIGPRQDSLQQAPKQPRFAVNVRTGCNGLETIYIFFAGVLAFPASWGRKLLGLAGGFLAIQLLNTVRIVSLFYIGVHFPEHFEDSHIVVWQAIVILFGVALFLLWADRYARPNRPEAPEAPR